MNSNPKHDAFLQAAKHLGQRLELLGISQIFAESCAGLEPFAKGFAQQALSLNSHHHLSESCAALSACARLQKETAVLLALDIPSLLSCAADLLSAARSPIPILIIALSSPSSQRGFGAYQELELANFAHALELPFHTIRHVEQCDAVLRAALLDCNSPSIRPVLLEFPIDQFIALEAAPATLSAIRQLPPELSSDGLLSLSSLLEQSRRPIFIVGSECYWSKDSTHIEEALTAIALPTLVNGLSRVSFSASGKQEQTSSMFTSSEARHTMLSEADLVVVFGTAIDFKLRFGSETLFAKDCRFALVSSDSSHFSKVRTTSLFTALLGEPSQSITRLCARFSSENDHPWKDWWERLCTLEGETKKRTLTDLPTDLFTEEAIELLLNREAISESGALLLSSRSANIFDNSPLGLKHHSLAIASGIIAAKANAKIWIVDELISIFGQMHHLGRLIHGNHQLKILLARKNSFSEPGTVNSEEEAGFCSLAQNFGFFVFDDAKDEADAIKKLSHSERHSIAIF